MTCGSITGTTWFQRLVATAFQVLLQVAVVFICSQALGRTHEAGLRLAQT